jgi:hypothetical protein
MKTLILSPGPAMSAYLLDFAIVVDTPGGPLHHSTVSALTLSRENTLSLVTYD